MLDNDHSLGNLSQVPMTKSVRRSIASQSHHQQQQQQQPTPALNTKRNALEIVTLNESDQNRVMLQPQPTATFANQR